MAIILGIVSNPPAIMRLTLPMANPSTPILVKNPVIFFSLTTWLSALSIKTISTCVSFHTYVDGSEGNSGFDAGCITSVMCGITSPLRIKRMSAPTPILFSSIKLALKPVAYSIVTPLSVTGSICTRGFKYPSLLGVQMTSTTLDSATWSERTILKAKA